MPAWRCAGPPLPCSRPPRASAGSRRRASFRRYTPPSPPIARRPRSPARLPNGLAPPNVTSGRAALDPQHRAGTSPRAHVVSTWGGTMELNQSVTHHYTHGNDTHGMLERAILDALATSGKDLDRLAPADLAPVDEFHIGGRPSTSRPSSRVS